MSKKLKKEELFREFNETFKKERESKEPLDFPRLSLAWGALKDRYCREGKVTPHNYQSWNYPMWIKRRKKVAR